MHARVSTQRVPQESAMRIFCRIGLSSGAGTVVSCPFRRLSFARRRLKFFLGHTPIVLLAAASFCAVVPVARAQSGANSDPNYVALRNIALGSEAVSVTNFD